MLNVFYHETGGGEWAIGSQDAVNAPVFFDNGASVAEVAAAGASGEEHGDDNVNSVGTPKNLKDILSFFVLGSSAPGHRRAGSDSSVSSADSDSAAIAVEDARGAVPLRSRSEIVRKPSSRSAPDGARRPFARSATEGARRPPVHAETKAPVRRQQSVSFESQSSDGESQGSHARSSSRLARPTTARQASEPLVGARLARPPDGRSSGRMQHRAASADNAAGIETTLTATGTHGVCLRWHSRHIDTWRRFCLWWW